MRHNPQVYFVQGAGTGAHDVWDAKLVESLGRELGDGYDVHYPRMPEEDDPSYPGWSAAIRGGIATLADGAVVVGHSIGGAVMVNALADQLTLPEIGAIVLIGAPFVGDGGWPGDGFSTPADLGARLPCDVPVHIFQGLADETTPPSHAALYAEAVPQARVHLLPGRDHQLNDDLSEIAGTIRGCE